MPESVSSDRRLPARGDATAIDMVVWPFATARRVATVLFKLLGRAAALVLGLVLMAVGCFFSPSLIGVSSGIPLVVVGFLLMVRALF